MIFVVVSVLAFSFSSAAQDAMVDGQVTKIDEAQGKITLRHGPLKKLDMDEPMTMVFRVQDPAMLKQWSATRSSSMPAASTARSQSRKFRKANS
jgi:Cu/Ag efflux protein CusF